MTSGSAQPAALCLDTNILLALRFEEPTAALVAAYLDEIDRLMVRGPVVAELMPREPKAENWLGEFGIEVDWNMGQAIWQRVGQAHADYKRRRSKSGGGAERTILTDYLIGAHAEVNGWPLLTLNERDYSSFSQREVLTP